jgi:uncharacterized membrane protein YesL
MLTYIADFALGLFVGVYALASFSPAEVAREVYRTCWFFCAGFVVLAFLQNLIAAPSSRSLLRRSQDQSVIFGLSSLEIAVLLGIGVAFIGGQQLIKRKLIPFQG